MFDRRAKDEFHRESGVERKRWFNSARQNKTSKQDLHESRPLMRQTTPGFRGKVAAFPSEQGGAIKRRQTQKQDGYELVRPLVIYTGV